MRAELDHLDGRRRVKSPDARTPEGVESLGRSPQIRAGQLTDPDERSGCPRRLDDTDPDVLEVLAGVAEWARPFLALPNVPPFGSADWLALPPEDHRRAAAVVRAALGWWRCGEPLEDVEHRVGWLLDRASAHGISAAAPWRDLAYRPTHAELQRRRDAPRLWTPPPVSRPWPDDEPQRAVS